MRKNEASTLVRVGRLALILAAPTWFGAGCALIAAQTPWSPYSNAVGVALLIGPVFALAVVLMWAQTSSERWGQD